jgi:hypothetical protein
MAAHLALLCLVMLRLAAPRAAGKAVQLEPRAVDEQRTYRAIRSAGQEIIS